MEYPQKPEELHLHYPQDEVPPPYGPGTTPPSATPPPAENPAPES
jgi:hypothetical protein